MTNYDKFLEQIKYISMVRSAKGDDINSQTLHHAFCVDPRCIKTSSGDIYAQAYDFVDLFRLRGLNINAADPIWLVYI